MGKSQKHDPTVLPFGLPFELPGTLKNLEEGRELLSPLEAYDVMSPLLMQIHGGLVALAIAVHAWETMAYHVRDLGPFCESLEQQLGVAIQLLDHMQVREVRHDA